MRRNVKRDMKKNLKKVLSMALCAIIATGSTSLAKDVGEIDNIKVTATSGEAYCSTATKDVSYRNGVVNLKKDSGDCLISFKMKRTVNGKKEVFGVGITHEGNRKEFTTSAVANKNYALWIALADGDANQAYVHGSWSPDVK